MNKLCYYKFLKEFLRFVLFRVTLQLPYTYGGRQVLTVKLFLNLMWPSTHIYAVVLTALSKLLAWKPNGIAFDSARKW